MRRVFLFCLGGLTACLLLSTAALAGGHNPADYPLRVHIFQFNGISHYSRNGPGSGMSSLDSVDGEGRANLYENGQPRGFEFSYSCMKRLMGSPGFETYMARWKKQSRVLEVLLPQMGGKPGEMDSCELKVNMGETVYVRQSGGLGEVSVAEFKTWMDKHQYDPEHGKNVPQAEPAPASPSGAK